MTPDDKTGDFRQTLGKRGENSAARYLQKNGYKIIRRGYRCRLGEIDIIAESGNYLIFCEVKTRVNTGYSQPFEALNEKKKRKIKQIASYYSAFVAKRPMDIRFDVISIILRGQNIEIEHIENAFE